MRLAVIAPTLLAAGLALTAGAQAPAPHVHGTPAVQAPANANWYDGQIKRINRDSGRVTLAHGPLKAFDMPAMTMAFAVKNGAQLARLKEGDKVRFSLEKAGDELVVTRIEPFK